jgi:protein-disulfide isomerase
MGKKAHEGGRKTGQRPSIVTAAKRKGPGTGFWIAFGAVLVIGVAAIGWLANRPKATVTQIDPSLPALKAEGYVMGSPTAPIEVTEFADFECPACGSYANLTEPDVRARLVNTGVVRIRYLDFPLEMHKNTWDASLAASCANDQGKFWQMHDQLFMNQDKWNTEATSRPRKPIAELAQGLGLDMAKYNSCMDAETHRAQIQANQREGERRQVAQTPTFIIGGKVHGGELPFDAFKALVDSELAKLPKAPPAKADSAKKGT